MLCSILSQYLGWRLHDESTSSSLRAEELFLLYVASVEKLMAQSNQYNLQKQIAANHSGFLVNLGSFRAVLDTYQGMAKTFARDVLHATFFLPRGDADVPQAITGRIDYLHQMVGLQTNKALCDEFHSVCKESIQNREAAQSYDFSRRVTPIEKQ